MHSRRLAICSWSLQPLNPLKLVWSIKQCGLQAVQLALVPLVEETEWENAQDVIRGNGIEIVSGMLATVGEDYSTLESIEKTGGIRPDETWPLTLSLAEKVADIGEHVGLSLVTFHAGFMPEHQCVERVTMLHRLAQLGDLFSNKGVELALETGQEDAHTLAGVLEELSHPHVGVNFDPANMILYGKGNPVQALELLHSWVKQVHIKDAITAKSVGQWGEEVPVGKGEVCWAEFLQQLPDGVDLVIEREAGSQRVEDVQYAVSTLREFGVC